MEASIVMILALLGVVGGRSILLPKADYLQLIAEDVTRHSAVVVKARDQPKTVDVQYHAVISNRKENTEDEILKLILKDFDNQAATDEVLLKSDTTIVEYIKDEPSLLVAEDGKVDVKWELADRMAIAGTYCFNGTEKIGNYCMPVDD